MADQPNVVLITTDQQRADFSKREGFPIDTTPFLDSLAEDGVWFDRAYCPFPVCCPARVSLLTGRFPSATGIRDNRIDDPPTYEADLFEVMNQAGYATALCGKNHSHLEESDADFWFRTGHRGGRPTTDAQEACDEWLRDHGAFGLESNPYPSEDQPGGRAVTAALEWLDRDVDGPFFLWLSIPEPHPPFQAPEPYFSMFDPDDLPEPAAGVDALEAKGFPYEWSRELSVARAAQQVPDRSYEDILPELRAIYCGMCRMVDDLIERFVTGLEAMKLRSETLLVMHSDHGEYAGQYGMMRKGAGLDDALARVPLLFDGPGIEPSDGPSDAHVSLVDLLPTVCAAIDVPIPVGVQGRSLWPLLTGEADPGAEFDSVVAEVGYGGLEYGWADEPSPAGNHRGDGETYGTCNTYTQAGMTRMVRRGDVKLTYTASGERRLYDLSDDPGEVDDRFEDPDYEDERTELTEALLRWSLRLADELPDPPRYAVKRTSENWYWAEPDNG